MKAFFHLHRTYLNWVGQSFPGGNPYFLPFLNKTLVEQWLDFCSMAGIHDVLIGDSEYDLRLAEIVGDGSKWALHAEYIGLDAGADASEALSHCSDFTKAGESILVFNGLFFLHFNKSKIPELSQIEQTGKEVSSSQTGVFLWNNGACAEVSLRISHVNSVKNYYDLNMLLIRSECDNYVIPGYKIEHGIYTGMNNVIPPTVHINAPAIFGNNVSLGHDCELVENTILGSNVIVDCRSSLKDTLVLPNTYLGEDLEFRGMIVYQNYVIDPDIPVTVNLSDAQLTGKLRTFAGFHFITTICGWCTALFLFCVMALPFLLFRLLGVKPEGRRRVIYRNNANAFPMFDYPAYPYHAEKTLSRHFHALSLDFFPLLPYVLSRKLKLVGDYRYDPEERNTRDILRDNYPSYLPGLFNLTLSNGSGQGETECLIDDLYYRHNRSLYLDCMILFRTLLRRLFRTSFPGPNHD